MAISCKRQPFDLMTGSALQICGYLTEQKRDALDVAKAMRSLCAAGSRLVMPTVETSRFRSRSAR
jgi:hypothetical protein